MNGGFNARVAYAAMQAHLTPAEFELVRSVLDAHFDRAWALLEGHAGEAVSSEEFARLLLSVARQVMQEQDARRPAP